ncbi:MAG: DDE-type integrase/transposase/recombinase [Colwellia sp.]|nr:DDE-type integrase/transposase/recombinase [Colwellia sp.]
MFQINEVVQLEDELYRILAIFQAEIAWIQIHNDRAFPSFTSKAEILSAIEDGTLVRKDDPFEYIAYETPEEGTVARKKRDHNFTLIEPIIIDEEALYSKVRAARIQIIIDANGSTKQTLYRLLRRFWQRGQTANTLLPDYKNSGAKGKKREAKGKKLGRPRVITPGVGAIVDANMERLFRQAIEKHLLTDDKNTLVFAHRKFKGVFETYYPNVSEAEMPTMWQMQHFYKREYKQVEVIQKRASSIEYQKDIRPLSGTANIDVLGPGSRFEIDATIADIYVVSNSERRNIIGRPVVYTVIDVFSRMVAGIYVGVEGPSYVTAMQALSNALTNKVEYCKSFGMDIEYKDWPISGLPDAILADRGELLGHQVESLERNFSVRIENTPPYRGDAKGIVERYFKTLQAKFKPFAPGIVTGTKIKKRGGKDYRLDAKLTINEFTEIILASVTFHNRYHPLTKYDRDIDMPTDLQMTPLSLWNWGLQHRTGKLRSVAVDAVTVTLMPKVKATFSDLGIRVFGAYYTCREIVQLGWLHRSKETVRPKYLEAAYDPRTANYIYLFPKANSSEYWLCELTQRSREFSGCSFWDLWQVTAEQKAALANSKLVSDGKHRELDQLIEDKIKQAKELMPDISDQSNAQRTKGIRAHRNIAKQEERQQTAYHPDKPKKGKLANVIPLTPQESGYGFPDYIDELFDEDE